MFARNLLPAFVTVILLFHFSDDIQMPCISEAASSDLDPSSVPNFTELFNLLQEGNCRDFN